MISSLKYLWDMKEETGIKLMREWLTYRWDSKIKPWKQMRLPRQNKEDRRTKERNLRTTFKGPVDKDKLRKVRRQRRRVSLKKSRETFLSNRSIITLTALILINKWHAVWNRHVEFSRLTYSIKFKSINLISLPIKFYLFFKRRNLFFFIWL